MLTSESISSDDSLKQHLQLILKAFTFFNGPIPDLKQVLHNNIIINNLEIQRIS